jgi:hypothetical protein
MCKKKHEKFEMVSVIYRGYTPWTLILFRVVPYLSNLDIKFRKNLSMGAES